MDSNLLSLDIQYYGQVMLPKYLHFPIIFFYHIITLLKFLQKIHSLVLKQSHRPDKLPSNIHSKYILSCQYHIELFFLNYQVLARFRWLLLWQDKLLDIVYKQYIFLHQLDIFEEHVLLEKWGRSVFFRKGS